MSRWPLLLCLWGASLSVSSAPQEGNDTLRPAPLIAVFPRNFPPIYLVTENNVPTGFGIEFAEEVAERADLVIQYRSVPTWFDAQQALANGDADLIPNMGITPSRMNIYDFTRPIHSIPVSLFTRVDNQDVKHFADLKGRTVGAVRRNVAVTLLRRDPAIDLKVVDSLSELLVALLEGSVEAVVYPEPNFNDLALRLGVNQQIRSVGSPLMTVPRAMAVRPGNEGLLAVLNTAIETILPTQEYRRLLQRWFPPPPPFWNARRVAILLMTVLIMVSLGWYVLRMRLLGRSNARLAEANTFINGVLDAALEGIVSVDHEGHIVSVNATAERLFGLDAGALKGRNISAWISGRDTPELWTAVAAGHEAATEVAWFQRDWQGYAHHTDGGKRPVRLRLAPISVDGASGFVYTLHDESREQEAERRADHLLIHDPLTGLLNLRGVRSALDSLIAGEPGASFCSLCIALPRLTHISGIYGHHIGDRILVQSAALLQKAMLDTDHEYGLLARVGGERFLLVVPQTGLADGIKVAGYVSRLFKALRVDGGDRREGIGVDARIGIACYPEHAHSYDELIYHSEIACLHANAGRLEAAHVFSPRESTEHSYAEQMLQRIIRALSQNGIRLDFQPIRHIASGRCDHYEALLRLQTDDGAQLMPREIIPVAEKFGMMNRIDRRVIELVAAQLMRGDMQGLSASVNLSATHLGDNELFIWIRKMLDQQPGLANRLVFEITETAALQNVAEVKEFMLELRELGCRFSLDDFGVGFTSFAQLRDLPVDYIKVDGMFVRELSRNEADRTLVKAITDVGHSLGKLVVAEYVENEAVYEILRTFGVDYAQGHYVGRPGGRRQEAAGEAQTHSTADA